MLVLRGAGLGDLGVRAGGGGAFEVTPTTGWTAGPAGTPGWNRFGIHHVTKELAAFWSTRRTAIRAELATSGMLKPCADVIGSGKARAYCASEARVGHMRILDPIGLIVELGVPLSPEFLAAGKIDSAYTPNQEQQFLADLAIYLTSQIYLTAILLADRSQPGSPIVTYAPDSSLLLFQDINDRLVSSEMQSRVDKTDHSIDGFIGRHPEFALSVPGYSMNPIEPTPDERRNAGGLRAYYKRGGFLLVRPVAEGRWIAARAGLAWNTGYCMCGDGPMATIKRAAGEGFGWDVYVTVGSQYKIKITPHDAPFWSEAATFAGTVMRELASFLCANRTTLQQLNTGTLLKDICVDVNGKTCNKGTQGCYCTPPTGTQQVVVGVANAGLSYWCSKIEPGINPPKQTPFIPPPPPPVPWTPPLWLVGVAGAALGAMLAWRKPVVASSRRS